MKKIIAFFLPSMAFAPVLVYAQRAGNNADASSILSTIQGILNYLIPMLITIAVIVFIWGVIQYVVAKDDAAKEKGRNVMIYGIVGLFVIVAMWGLVKVLANTFLGGGYGTAAPVPCVPGTGQYGC